jgi:hypothetical protein
MSKKVFKWLIADIIFAIIITYGIIFVKKFIAIRFDSMQTQMIIHKSGTVISIIADLIILFWFLLYWWSDRKWTNIKNKFNKIRNNKK